MANAPQGTFRFAGVFAEGEFQVSRTGSTKPDTITAQFPLNAVIPQYGNIQIAYGQQYITLPDCRVVRTEIQGGANGRYREVQFEDRRWRWQYAYAFGNVNVSLDFFFANQLSAVDVINNLLAIVGDANPAIIPPNALVSIRPDRFGNVDEHAKWTAFYEAQHFDGRTVAECLEEILSFYNLRLFIGWDNRVRIYVPGYGRSIPDDQRVMDYTVSATPPVVPETVVFEFPRVTFRNDFVLEAVGYTWSYADVPNFFRITDKRIRELCRRTIFKLYRINSSIRVSLLNPFLNSNISGLGLDFNPDDFILDNALWIVNPLSGQISQPAPVKWQQAGVDQDYQRLLFDDDCNFFTVMGYFADRTLHQINNNAPNIPSNYQMTGSEFRNFDETNLRIAFPNSIYNGSFEFDAEERTVKLSDALVFINRNNAGAVQSTTYLPAKLLLRAEHKLRRRADMEIFRLVVPYRLNSPVSSPGLVEKIRVDYPLLFSPWGSLNLQDIERTASPFFANYVASKFASESATVPMKGFAFDISPDGNIPTVSFSRNSSGQCTTSLQWQKENPVIFPMYDELTKAQRDREMAAAYRRNIANQSRKLQPYLKRLGFP
jgi:hypothetical protein